MTAFADILRAHHRPQLDAFVHHPFFRAVEDGKLIATARDAYFINEGSFVGAAVGIFAHILTKAPSGAQPHLVAILNGLVHTQLPFFAKLYGDLNITVPPEPPAAARALSDGMTEIAREGSYGAGVAAMLAAEWSYATVARRGGWRAADDETIRHWFALHAEDAFLDGVAWLEAEVNAAGEAGGRQEMDNAFGEAIALEIEFHDAPLH
ncbi:MAG: TenA family protein [Pseudomonadota bacterium]